MRTTPLGPYVAPLRPRRPALVIGVLAGIAFTGLLGGVEAVEWLAGTPSPDAALGCVLLVVVGQWAWRVASDPWPITLNAWFGAAPLLVGLAVTLGARGEEQGLQGDAAWGAATVGASGLAVLVTALGLLVRRRRRTAYLREVRVIELGTARHAIIRSIGPAARASRAARWRTAPMELSYRDDLDRDCGTRQRLVVPAGAPPIEQDGAALWVDPEDPSRAPRVVVAFDHAARWNVPDPAKGLLAW